MRKHIGTWILIGILAADLVLGAGIWLQEKKAEAAQWIGTIPMANQHITWEGAGYSFHWGEDAD